MMKNSMCFGVMATLMSSVGCTGPDTPITTEMHEDFDHTHKHQHTGEDEHEHKHDDDFRGSHSHGHSHSHRHGEPLHGGRIVSIGHTHHEKGATHFHAEVMPLTGNTIRFYLLSETDDGKSLDFPIADKELTALVSIKGREASGGEHAFGAVGEGDSTAEFSLVIPEHLLDGDEYAVVIPRITLDGQRQNFSFVVARPGDSDDTSDAASPQETNDE